MDDQGTPEYSARPRAGLGRGCAAAGCALAAIIVIAVWIFGAYQGAYNRLVAEDEKVREAWSQVENDLQRRNDLIPNLVRTVRGTAAQERAVFGQIADARARLAGAGAGPSKEKIAASNEMSSAISRLLVVVENYPTLQSNESFLALQDQIEGTENRLAHAREVYNRAVQEYNGTARSFPMNLFIHMTPFEPQKPYFEAPPEARQAPVVDFETPAPGAQKP